MSVVRDEIDREHLNQVVESRGYQMISEAIKSVARRRLNDLRKPVGPEKTAYLRGFLDGLEAALGMPAVLLRSARKETYGSAK